MKPEIKAAIMGILALPLALIFIVWGLMDILSVTGGSTELLIIVPVIVTIIYIAVIVVSVLVSFVVKRRNILYKKVHNCSACGAEITLEEKFCNVCGEENIIRYEALTKLKELEIRIEEHKIKNKERTEKLQNKRFGISKQNRKIQNQEKEMLLKQELEVRKRKIKILTGGTHEGTIRWIKEQYCDLKRTIQEIADDLGESMIAVRKCIDEIENQDM